jgi:hypothetical protein
MSTAGADGDAAWEAPADADGGADAGADGDAVAPPPDEQAERTKANAANGVNVRVNARLLIKLDSPPEVRQ